MRTRKARPYDSNVEERPLLILYFSGTGNTAYLAHQFADRMGAKCLSIEADADFSAEIQAQDTIAFCYPIYGSRPPRMMREFVARYAQDLHSKRVIIFVTQVQFSGDGARSLLDSLPPDHVEVIYAEHFNMPNNVSNLWPLYRQNSPDRLEGYRLRAMDKLDMICADIRASQVKKRGFSFFSRFLGALQGVPWLKFSESLMGRHLKIHKNCTNCSLCVTICPTQNLEHRDGKIVSQNQCIVCYRCVNRCPVQAITVLIHQKPKWQYTEGFSWEKF